jgi:putative ATP-binding cassette transporter
MPKLITLLLEISVLWPTLALIASLVAGVSTTLTMVILIKTLYGDHDQHTLTIFWTFILVNLAGRGVSRLLIASVTRQTIYRIRQHLVSRVIDAPLSDLEGIGTARIYNVIANEASQLGTALPVVVSILSNIAFVCGCFVYLAWVSIECFLVVIFTLTISTIVVRRLNSKTKSLVVEARTVWEDIVADCSLIVDGIKQLKLSTSRQQLMKARLAEHSRRSTVIWSSHSRYANASFISSEFAFYLVITAVTVSPSVIGLPREIVLSYGLAIVYMWGPLREITRALPALTAAEVARSQIDKMGVALDKAVAIPGKEIAPAQPCANLSSWHTLRLLDVGYAYQSDLDQFEFHLSNINVDLERGSIVFIVGGNGSGKTTLAKVISGLYVPTHGSLMADDIAVEANGDWFVHQCSAIFSDFVIFEEVSETDNIKDQENCVELLKKLHLSERLAIDNMRFSRTKGLSSGERKRAALLTAIIDGRPLIIFDEWAADQDPVFKDIFYYEILPELREQGRLVIVISHDDRYFSVADKIISLERGAAARVTTKARQERLSM